MKRVLVPLDGSDFAEQALDPGVALAIRDGAEIHLLSVVSTEPPIPLTFADPALLGGWVDEEGARKQAYIERTAAGVAARAGGCGVEAHVRVGRVDAIIREVAEEFDVDLVVATTHGRGAFQRVWLGSTADRLLRSLERPLLLLPPTPAGADRFAEAQIRHVLVPLDGSKAAEAALDVLPLVLPGSEGVRLTLATVVEEGFALPAAYLPHAVSEESVRDERRKKAAAYLAATSQRVEGDGLGAPETHVLTADSAAHGLLRYCKEADVDMIALSTHGRSGVSRFAVGSVADKLARGAGIPVLVIRRPSDESP